MREGWRKFDEFHNSYSSPNTVTVIELRKIRCVIHVAHKAQMCTSSFGRKISGKRSLGRPMCRQYKSKTDYKAILYKGVVRIYVAQKRNGRWTFSEHGSALLSVLNFGNFLIS
jgi:hypothetical protein